MAPRRFGRFGRFSGTPVVIGTIVALVAMFLVVGFTANVARAVDLGDLLALDGPRVMAGEVWRLVTYGLVHSMVSPFHLLFNALMLYMFGRDLEGRLGSGRFLAFSLAAVFVGGLFVMGGWLLGIGSPYVIGFSAAVEACIVAWALFNRDAQVMFFFAIPMRGIHMLALAVLSWILDAVSASPVSASAHLGGIVTGLALWFFVARRNRIKLFFMELGGKKPKLTVVPPKNDRWVN